MFSRSGRLSDVFISYARSSNTQARRIAEALRALGHDVWRDDALPAHRDYAEVIEEQLRAAKAVVVVWCAEAVRSQWVRAEADIAREAGTLVQLTLDGAGLPMPFSRIHCADMAGWTGDLNAPGWRKVASSVAELADPGAAPAPAPPNEVEMVRADPLLAILAFDNLSGDPDMAYFSDGVSEEIQQTVARGADLKVIGRTSSFRFRGADKAVRKVVADLRATHILDGSVRRSGSRVRISAQLIECSGETTLWSDRFDRDLTDIFALQDEIAAAVAEALQRAFRPTAPSQRIDPANYELYLRAMRSELRDDVGQSARIEACERLVDAAPQFGPGWAALAYSRSWRLRYGGPWADYDAKRDEAIETIEKALSLDPHAGLAHAAQEQLEPWGRYAEREAAASKAIAAAPNDPYSLLTMGRMGATLGRYRESDALLQRAYELEPLSAGTLSFHAGLRFYVGRLDEAEGLLLQLVTRFPEEEWLAAAMLLYPAFQGDWERFERVAEPILARGLHSPRAQQVYRRIVRLRNPGKEGRRRLRDRLRDTIDRTQTAEMWDLYALYVMGMKEEAWALIDQVSFAHRFDPRSLGPSGTTSPTGMFTVGGAMDMPLDPRFVGLCAKMGLCDYWISSGKWPDVADQVPYDFRAEAHRLAVA